MKTMIKTSTGWNVSKLLLLTIFSFALTACGGGDGSSEKILHKAQELIATGKAADLEEATDLLLKNQDNLSATDFEKLMDIIAQG